MGSFNSKGNFAIVGSFTPEIEIWNLDLVDVLEPDVSLGNFTKDNNSDSKYFKNFKKNKVKKNTIDIDNYEDGHTDAVISLDINPFNKHILISGSADKKIIQWDLNKLQPSRIIKEHNDKVQFVGWNKCEENILLSGSFDNTIKLYDIREKSSSMTIPITSSLESIDWNPINKYKFLSSFENGMVECYDIRNLSNMLNFSASKKAITNISYSHQKEDLFTTVGLDGFVKVWDGQNTKSFSNNIIEPNLICEKYIKKTNGELFCAKFAPDLNFTLSIGGSKGELFIWELEENKQFCERFGLKYEEDIQIKTKKKE
jgi:periodic tryptophan protein 1